MTSEQTKQEIKLAISILSELEKECSTMNITQIREELKETKRVLKRTLNWRFQ